MELCRPANIGENIHRGLAVKARPHSIWAASERIAMAATRYMALKRLLAGRYFESVDELRDAIVQIVQNEMKAVEIKVYAT